MSTALTGCYVVNVFIQSRSSSLLLQFWDSLFLKEHSWPIWAWLVLKWVPHMEQQAMLQNLDVQLEHYDCKTSSSRWSKWVPTCHIVLVQCGMLVRVLVLIVLISWFEKSWCTVWTFKFCRLIRCSMCEWYVTKVVVALILYRRMIMYTFNHYYNFTDTTIETNLGLRRWDSDSVNSAGRNSKI